MGSEATKAIEASDCFWNEPSMDKIGKVSHPPIQYKVGQMYRGNKSIITAEELKACLKILNAFRRYKIKRLQQISQNNN